MRKSFGARWTMVVATALATMWVPRAGAQEVQFDSRWSAWVGCWRPTITDMQATADTAGSRVVCVVPAPGSSAVEILTVMAGKVVSRTTVDATGTPRSVLRDGCGGSETGEWSGNERRVYMKGDLTCPGGVKRHTSALFAITPSGEWLAIQNVTVDGNTSLELMRYQDAGLPATLPAEISAVLAGRSLASATARVAAGGTVTLDHVVEAAGRVDAPVVQAWLAEREESLGVDAQGLAKLADARVPPSIIDVVVAVSYPGRFRLTGTSRDVGLQLIDTASGPPRRGIASGGGMYPGFGCYGSLYGYSSLGYSPFGYMAYSPYGYSPYGYSPYSSLGYSTCGSRYGVGTRFGGLYGGRTIIVQRAPGGIAGQGGGRVVNGRGYSRRAGSTTTGSARGRPSVRAGSGRSAGAGAARSGGGRTAAPRSRRP